MVGNLGGDPCCVPRIPQHPPKVPQPFWDPENLANTMTTPWSCGRTTSSTYTHRLKRTVVHISPQTCIRTLVPRVVHASLLVIFSRLHLFVVENGARRCPRWTCWLRRKLTNPCWIIHFKNVGISSPLPGKMAIIQVYNLRTKKRTKLSM